MGKFSKLAGFTAALFLVGGLLTACGSEKETTSTKKTEEVIEKPSLEATFEKENNKVTITWNTNLKVSAEHYGGEHVEGEGHAHVYVNGEKVAGLKSTEPYVVEGLNDGTHEIKIELQKNNHESYGVHKVYEAVVGSTAGDAPTLEASFAQEGNTVKITWATNLTVSAEHYGGEDVEGEGHAHVYVDGEKVAGLKSTEPYVVEGLSSGKHKIEIALQKNNHDPLNVARSSEVEIQ